MRASMRNYNPRRVVVLLTFVIAFSPPLGIVRSQEDESVRTFPETGRTVQGVFLKYWKAHGGLRQQGCPISTELQERSDTDGKVYPTQYFERVVLEYHPENDPPNNVLLSQLGTFRYHAKLASAQIPSGKLAFASTRDGNREIYSMSSDGSNQRRLTDNPANDRTPPGRPTARI